MDSIIETARQTHEEIERYEQALAEVLMQNPTAQRNITRRDRKAAEILTRVGELRSDLLEQYEDLPGLRPIELSLLSAPPPGKDDLAEFYSRFEKIKDFHKRNPGINARAFINDLDELVKGDGMQVVEVEGDDEPTVIDPLDSVFSGEESYGKHLDLYQSHTQYLNLRGSVRLSYIAYLDMLKHGKVERTLDLKEKLLPQYIEYVQTLYNYLVSFFERALPLTNIQSKLKEEEANFASAWEAIQISGWEPESSTSKRAPPPTEGGIWCEYCGKSYAKQTVYDAHLSSEKHKKKVQQGTKVVDPNHTNVSHASTTTLREKARTPARYTYLVIALLASPPIPQLLIDSRAEIERRMALTARERETEREEGDEAPPPAPAAEEEEEEEDDGRVYNPLKLPLGWDGKPIPFWLYKLHGLGQELPCELCSTTYQGRQAFEKHFQSPKHTFALQALGLPPTRHFHGITKITDAMALGEKLKREGQQELAQIERAEEVEDSEGNVYDRKTYEQLRKQGVIH
ncbi:splicing factor 3A subunit 3 [Tremella mesenterica]|uniref:Splicing factor 3A subunit 3 n=1 Tax=Tremella mesenterica TaxID=5217 RepID=A0A4Q1BR26_TREME|nr:uncharacterized protein TREMEDRAFT_40877 [Tremella mesenterica DSM 1558]EIW66571.1 hypothetical protein TREMEDRAFT_40877 [Tremella mesenterica DSM 1558]RXK40409.1 splicing factor 3A subunit 3 [Tremella mesenterica]